MPPSAPQPLACHSPRLPVLGIDGLHQVQHVPLQLLHVLARGAAPTARQVQAACQGQQLSPLALQLRFVTPCLLSMQRRGSSSCSPCRGCDLHQHQLAAPLWVDRQDLLERLQVDNWIGWRWDACLGSAAPTGCHAVSTHFRPAGSRQSGRASSRTASDMQPQCQYLPPKQQVHAVKPMHSRESTAYLQLQLDALEHVHVVHAQQYRLARKLRCQLTLHCGQGTGRGTENRLWRRRTSAATGMSLAPASAPQGAATGLWSAGQDARFRCAAHLPPDGIAPAKAAQQPLRVDAWRERQAGRKEAQ